MQPFINSIKNFLGIRSNIADSRTFQNQSTSTTSLNSPTETKRLRLTVPPENFYTMNAAASTSTPKTDAQLWVSAQILKLKYLESLRRKKLATSPSRETIDIDGLDRYKSLVNSSHRIRSTTSSNLSSSKHKIADEVICIDSDDSEDDVIEVNPVKIIDDSTDSEVIEIPTPKPSKRLQKRKTFLEGDSFKDLLISTVISVDSDSEDDDVIMVKQLDNEQEALVQSVFSDDLKDDEKIITKFKLTITKYDIKSLEPSNWLNDQIINFYLNLIMERSQKPNLPNVYAMNTFFFTNLYEGGFATLRRWTRKIDIFSFHLILIPFNQSGVHWCLFMINMKKKIIELYDSLAYSEVDAGKKLLQYLADELWDKKHKIFDVNKWKISCMEGIPHQLNGSDCGVFTCTIAEHLTRKASLTFTQEDMPYFRKKMCLEIIQGHLLL